MLPDEKGPTASEVANADLNRHPGRPLVAPGQVVRQPRDVPREGGIDTADCDEDTGVDQARYASSGGGDADDETDGYGGHAPKDEWRTLAVAVGEPGHRYRQHGSCDIDGNGEQLRGGRSVT